MKVAFLILAFLALANATCYHEGGGIGEYHKACDSSVARKINQLIIFKVNFIECKNSPWFFGVKIYWFSILKLINGSHTGCPITNGSLFQGPTAQPLDLLAGK
jgi:hypothetical protein